MTGAKRCLTCGYILDRLPEARCPECGRGFDPGDPATYVVVGRTAKALLYDAWIAAVLAAFGPGTLLVAWLTGSFPVGNILSVSMVAVSPHLLFGAVLGGLVFRRCWQMPAASFADERSRRRLHQALWLAASAGITSAGFFALSVLQIGRTYRLF